MTQLHTRAKLGGLNFVGAERSSKRCVPHCSKAFKQASKIEICFDFRRMFVMSFVRARCTHVPSIETILQNGTDLCSLRFTLTAVQLL